MLTAMLVRRHIHRLTGNKPFSIRDFLNYGSRNAVDQIFYRLVKSGQLIRVARGIFIKHADPMPAVSDIVLVKAAAFGKTIAIHGLQAARQLGLTRFHESNQNSKINDEHIYACSGSTSSFCVGKIRIYLRNANPRKLFLANTPTGLVIRAICHLGHALCSARLIYTAVASFNRIDRETLRQSMHLMPGWLAANFIAVMGVRNL